jgi:hypothetical protein
VPLGKFLRAALQAADFVNAGLRGALRPVPDRSEPANTLQRAIDSGRVVPARVKRADEDQAGTRALSLLAKMLTAWNTP